MAIKKTKLEIRQEKLVNKFLKKIKDKKSKAKKKQKDSIRKNKKKLKEHFKTKKEYRQELRDQRWIKLRNEIIERDGFLCTKCGSNKNLSVHHKKYIKGRKAWEYPDELLITLCSYCHAQLHNYI